MGEQRRPEDGPMCFGDDWPGVFLRGDTAFAYAMHLRSLLDAAEARGAIELDVVMLRGLLADLAGCRVTSAGEPPETQRLKPWAECVAATEGER